MTIDPSDGGPQESQLIHGWREVAALTAILLVAAALRLPLVLGADFPLHDGGLFSSAVEDIREAGYALPRTLSYNGDHVPFVYPPLFFYVAAILADIGSGDVLAVLRVLPAVLSVASILAFYLMAVRLLSSRQAALIASIVFVLIPGSFLWLVMGGGLTRAGGLTVGLLALAAADVALADGGSRRLVTAGLLIGLTGLSHPEVALQVGLVFLSIGLLRYRTRIGLQRLAKVAVVAAITVGPWLLVLMARHGVGPVLAAPGATHIHSESMLGAIGLGFTAEAVAPVFALMAVLGCFAEVAQRRMLLPLWLLAIFILMPRSAFTWGSVPAALLVSAAVCGLVVPGVRAVGQSRKAVAITLGLFAAAILWHGVAELRWMADHNRVLAPVPAEDVAAMRWIAANTPQDAAFVVVESEPWLEDAVGEWFPAVTRRHNLLVLQGTEWLGEGIYRRRYQARLEAWQALRAGPREYQQWLDNFDHPTDLFVPTRSAADYSVRVAVAEMVKSGRYRVVYQRNGSVVVGTADTQ